MGVATVKAEIRRNAIARIKAGEPLFPGVLGYESTVMPQLENALLAGHDVIFLGERGQAKTRMIRSLTSLLDEWMPIVAGSEINDDPYAPVSRHARDLVAEHGDDTPIAWVHRDDRYGEKLATPDTSIADLIGEVDPIKVAEGRYLSDELTLHYGLVPRTNRGIFAINELPDLAERIQVGLLNVLEERDVQIRGYKIRLPLDVLLVASANPEDYTNRGRIITPLKDRFGSQIRTHYPLDADTEVDDHGPGGQAPRRSTGVGRGARLHGRDHRHDQPARPGQHPRQPAQRRQRAAVGRQLRDRRGQRAAPRAASGESVVVPRVDDLDAMAAARAARSRSRRSTTVARARSSTTSSGAVLTVFKARVAPEHTRDVIAAFEEGAIAHTGEDVPSRRARRARRDGAGAARAGRRRSPAATSRRPRSPPPSRSCSRACTCPSA